MPLSQNPAAMADRNLGLGFGEDNQFIISLKEPNKALINELPFSEEVMSDIRAELKKEIANIRQTKKAQQPIPQVTVSDLLRGIFAQHFPEGDIENIVQTSLALFIPDVLVDMNVTRLTKSVIPKTMLNTQFKSLIAQGLVKFFKWEQGKLQFFIGEDGQSNYKSLAACRLFLRNLPGHPSPRQVQKQATSMPPAALAVLVPLDFDPPSGLKIYAPQ